MSQGSHIRLLGALSRAEDALSRADEALSGVVGDGVIARLAYQDACALAWNQGELVHLEDLVLRDEDLDVRMPDPALLLAGRQLRTARLPLPPKAIAFSLVSVKALLPRRAGGALGLTSRSATAAPDLDVEALGTSSLGESGDGLDLAQILAAAGAVQSDDDKAALEAWIALCRGLAPDWPPLLRAACALEFWAVIDPLPRYPYIGALLVGWELRLSGRLRRHRPWIALGQRKQAARGELRRASDTATRRVCYWLGVLATSGEVALDEVERLGLVRQVLARKLVGRRSTSRLADLVALLIECPVVTAGSVAARLRVTQQAARVLVRELGPSVAEITGRTRYRAWRV